MRRLILFPLLFVLIVSMACTIGGKSKKPTAAPPEPTAVVEVADTPEPLPTDTEEVIVDVPTDTPEPIVLDEPTATPEAQVDAPTEVPQSSGDYFEETFSGDLANLSQWVTAGDKNKDFAKVVDGKLRIDLPSAETYSYITEEQHTYSDVYVEVKFQPILNGRNDVAALCRISDQGWYEFRVSTAGQYAGTYEVYRYDYTMLAQHKNPYINLIVAERVYSTDIKTGLKNNTIGLACEGQELRLYINGVEQTKHNKKIMDDVLSEGTVGLGAMSFSGGLVRIDFESLSTGK